MKKLFGFVMAIALFSFCFCFGISNREKVGASSTMVDSGINYVETTSSILNPDQGFLHMFTIDLSNKSSVNIENVDEWINGTMYKQQGWYIEGGTKFFLLTYNLNNYSPAMGGTAKNITQNDLTSISKDLDEIRKADGTCIVRFSYDRAGVTYGTNKDCEPSLEWVLKHTKQLAEIVSQNKDVITAVETGMFGPWGEQHSTTLSDINNSNSFYQLVECWLNNTPSDVDVLVRRPQYFLHWYNTKYNKKYTTSNIDTLVIDPNSTAGRVGCYNDGYLGSKSDWGTYTNREKEVNWLSGVKFVSFGGEVLADDSIDIKNSMQNGIGTYNKRSYIEVEGYKTHTSFLNYHYNYENVIYHWEQSTYTGNDPVYKNKVSDFQFIKNRLGYRLVIRSSKLSSLVDKGEQLNLEVSIENVGFGNITRAQSFYLIIADNSQNIVATQKLNISEQEFLSKTTNKLTLSYLIPQTFSSGNYNAYIKVINSHELQNSTMRTIRFANDNVYNQSLGANYLGSFSVSNKVASTPTSSVNSSSQQPATSAVVSSSQAQGSSKTESSSKAQSSSKVQNSRKPYSSKSQLENNSLVNEEDNSLKKGCTANIKTGGSTFVGFAIFMVLALVALLRRKKSK